MTSNEYERARAIHEYHYRHADSFRNAIEVARLHANEAYTATDRRLGPNAFIVKVLTAFDTVVELLKLNPPV